MKRIINDLIIFVFIILLVYLPRSKLLDKKIDKFKLFLKCIFGLIIGMTIWHLIEKGYQYIVNN